ncbi:hypothetical protein MASR2M78_31610 [Treponema sp.]
MDVLHNQVFATTSLSELFIAWSRFPDSCVYAGGTEILRGQGGLTLQLPQNILIPFTNR